MQTEELGRKIQGYGVQPTAGTDLREMLAVEGWVKTRVRVVGMCVFFYHSARIYTMQQVILFSVPLLWSPTLTVTGVTVV